MLSAQLADEISKQIKGIEPKKYTDNQGQLAYKIPEPLELKNLAELCNGSEPVFLFICGAKEVRFRDNTRLEPAGCTGLFVFYSKKAKQVREDQRKEAIAEQARLEKERLAAKRKSLIQAEVIKMQEQEKIEAGIFEGQVNEDQKISLEKQAENNLLDRGIIK